MPSPLFYMDVGQSEGTVRRKSSDGEAVVKGFL
jgi:hypothetical protein